MISVGVDLDGVLRNFTVGAVRAIEKHRPDLRPFLVDDPRDVSSQSLDGMMVIQDMDKEREIRRVLFKTKAVIDTFAEAPPYPDDLQQYREAVPRLREAGANVLICTSQQSYPQKLATTRWLYKHDLDTDGVIMAHSNKGAYGLDWHVDDKRKNVAAVTRAGGQGVLRARPGNGEERRSVKSVVHSFEDFANLVISSDDRDR